LAQDAHARNPPPQTVTILTDLAGLAPDEVESLVAHPIEAAVNGLAHVLAVRSASTAGRSTVWVDFSPGEEMSACRQAVAERLQLVVDRLPSGARPRLAPAVAHDGHVLLIAITDDTLDDLARRMVAERLQSRVIAIPGVAAVAVQGGRLPSYEVVVSPDRLRAFDLPLQEVIAAVAKAGTAPKGGVLKLPEKETIVRIGAKGGAPESIASAVVSTRDGRPILVRDVAAINFGGQTQAVASVCMPKDGKAAVSRAVMLAVHRSPGTKVDALAAAVRRVVEQSQEELPSSVRLTAETFGPGDLSVALRGPAGLGLDRWLAVLERAQAAAAPVPGVQAIWSIAGEPDDEAAGHQPGASPTTAARMRVRLLAAKPAPPGNAATPRRATEIAADIRNVLRELPGVTASVATGSQPRDQLAVKVLGPELEQLQTIAEAARTRLSEVGGLMDLRIDPPGAVPQMNVEIDRERAARLGITVSDVAEVAQAACLGRVAGAVVEHGQRRDVLVRYDERSRASPEVIGKTLLAAAGGERVPLSSLVEIKETTGPRVIYRENGQRRVTVAIGIEGRKPSDAVAAARQALADLELPRGYMLVWDLP
jgi:Cu/Ag efflux pump CusA